MGRGQPPKRPPVRAVTSIPKPPTPKGDSLDEYLTVAEIMRKVETLNAQAKGELAKSLVPVDPARAAGRRAARGYLETGVPGTTVAAAGEQLKRAFQATGRPAPCDERAEIRQLHRKARSYTGDVETDVAIAARRPSDADVSQLEAITDTYQAAKTDDERKAALAERDRLLEEWTAFNARLDEKLAADREQRRIAKLPPPPSDETLARSFAWLEVRAIEISYGIDPDTVELLTVPRLYELLGHEAAAPVEKPAALPDPQATKVAVLDAVAVAARRPDPSFRRSTGRKRRDTVNRRRTRRPGPR